MIELRDLTKLYDSGRGIRGLDFRVEEGQALGFLGPNGAGKTTTIRVLMGFLRPSEGRCTVAGLDCWREAKAVQALVGYLPGELAFLKGMTGAGFLDLLEGMRRQPCGKRRDELVERFDLDVGLSIKKMSKGMKQKLAIVAAFMHAPTVYLMDEPTSGLDPLMRTVFYDLVAEELERGVTILMSSHSFEEVERSCGRAAIIREGELVDLRDVDGLGAEQRRAFVVSFRSEEEAANFESSVATLGYRKGRRVELFIQGPVDPLLKELAAQEIENLESRSMSLEQVFMHYYGGEGDT